MFPPPTRQTRPDQTTVFARLPRIALSSGEQEKLPSADPLRLPLSLASKLTRHDEYDTIIILIY